MQILSSFRSYSKEEDGAVTVDWVVLTAALCIMAIAVVATIKSGSDSSATLITGGISTHVASALS